MVKQLYSGTGLHQMQSLSIMISIHLYRKPTPPKNKNLNSKAGNANVVRAIVGHNPRRGV